MHISLADKNDTHAIFVKNTNPCFSCGVWFCDGLGFIYKLNRDFVASLCTKLNKNMQPN